MGTNKIPDVIKQAARENWTKLDLGKHRLNTFPLEICNLNSLKELCLPFNGLKEMPAEISRLTNLVELNISYNQLTKLPPEIGRLKNLTKLVLSHNQLVELPPEIGQLKNLTSLSLFDNQIIALPPEIGKLTNLLKLDLAYNELTETPPEIGKLSNLTLLYLYHNRLTRLSPEIGRLENLILLDIASNQLTELHPEIGNLKRIKLLYLYRNRFGAIPPEIGRLTTLEEINVSHNNLTELPQEIVKLHNLQDLNIDDNPITSVPPEIIKQGMKALLVYMREQLQGSKRQWLSKILLVGEGGVGKTSLLRALNGDDFDPDPPATHGIVIRSLDLAHPEEQGITMRLKTWDFGGEEIYHATHQFFLTDRSLFLLVWNARYGFEQGKLYYWLDTIQAKAPESPVIIVATHIDQWDAGLPFDKLRSKYPQIVSKFEVSNKDGAGIDKLRDSISDTAAKLPLMGETWPATWLNAAESIRAREEKYIAPNKLWEIMAGHGVSGDNARILKKWLHELGDILFFLDDQELNDKVILKPQWVSECISRVLRSKHVIENSGILSRADMDELWADLEPAMRNHFLRLMERFDLSYRTMEDREISLVVERLPLNPPPDLEINWDRIKNVHPCHEISIKYQLHSIPAGIPTRFIARSHRFTTHNHWRTGALLADGPEQKHLVLMQAFPHDKYIQLTARGPNPYNFFVLLRDGLDLTLSRFPGLKIIRLIACPGHGGQPCSHEFNYMHLQKAINKDPPVLEIQCPVSLEMVSVSEMLFGLHRDVMDEVMSRLDTMQAASDKPFNEFITLVQREFTKNFAREQSKPESHCPNYFSLRPVSTGDWDRDFGGKIELHLYCQAPGCWHPAEEGGRYIIDSPRDWLMQMKIYIQSLAALFKYVSHLAGPWTCMNATEYKNLVESDKELMQRMGSILSTIEETCEYGLTDFLITKLESERSPGTAFRTLRQLLRKIDPDQHWGGLTKVLTPEGHYLWLCKYHAAKYD